MDLNSAMAAEVSPGEFPGISPSDSIAAGFTEIYDGRWNGWYYGPMGLLLADFVESTAPNNNIIQANWICVKTEPSIRFPELELELLSTYGKYSLSGRESQI